MQSYQDDYHQLIELDGDIIANSTLAPWNCPITDTDVAAFGSEQAAKWGNLYLVSAQKRLSPFISGVPLSISLLFSMQSLCAYEVRNVQSCWDKGSRYILQTVALGYSAFCSLFTEEEWKGFSYSFGERLLSRLAESVYNLPVRP